MTVKCLTQEEKQHICDWVSNFNQKEAANTFGVSERTVYRVLQEHGVLKSVPRLNREEQKAKALLEVYGITLINLAESVTNFHVLLRVVGARAGNPRLNITGDIEMTPAKKQEYVKANVSTATSTNN